MTRPQLPTRTVVYASILVALVAVFVVQEATTSRRNTVTLPDLPDTVNRIVLAEGGVTLELSRAAAGEEEGDSDWTVGEGAYPAQEESILELVEPLRSVASADVVSTREGWNQFGLEEATRRTVTYYAAGDEVLVVDLGNRASAGDQVYARIARGREVVLLPGALATGFSTDDSDFRPREIVNLVQDEVVSVTIASPDGPSVTARRVERAAEGAAEDGAGAGGTTDDAAGGASAPAAWEIDAELEVDGASVDALVSALGPLRADGFPEATPTGEPFATVTVNPTSGEPVVLSFWPPDDDRSYPATASSYDYPFLVSDWRARRLLLRIDAYFDAFDDAESAG